MRTFLHLVECDFDNELRSHVDDVPFATDFALEKLLCLPLEHFVGHAFESLAEHDETAGLRIARAEMNVAQPTLSSAGSPFDGEDHQIEGARGFYLYPR